MLSAALRKAQFRETHDGESFNDRKRGQAQFVEVGEIGQVLARQGTPNNIELPVLPPPRSFPTSAATRIG